MLPEHDRLSSLIQQAKELALDIKHNIYGPSLEPLRIDSTTQYVCRENITNTFTLHADHVYAHTFIFWENHGERKNGNEPRTFMALRGKAHVHVGDRVVTLRRGESITIQPGETWDIYQAGFVPFEYSVKLPGDFNVDNVPGEHVFRNQLPDISNKPYTGPFNYGTKAA